MLGLRLTYALTVPPASVTSNKVCSTTSGIFFSNSALALLQQLDNIWSYAAIRRLFVPPFPLVSFAGRPHVSLRLSNRHPKFVHSFRSRLACPARSGALATATRIAGIRWRPCAGQPRGRPLPDSVRQNADVNRFGPDHFLKLADSVSAASDEFHRSRAGTDPVCVALFARSSCRKTASEAVAF